MFRHFLHFRHFRLFRFFSTGIFLTVPISLNLKWVPWIQWMPEFLGPDWRRGKSVWVCVRERKREDFDQSNSEILLCVKEWALKGQKGCVLERERKRRERARGCSCVSERVCERENQSERERGCSCVCEREKEREWSLAKRGQKNETERLLNS